jgi:hypothetical protein
MTAPYTKSPANVIPRRLRTEEGPSFGIDTFIVGCGYAARTNRIHTRLVRLADGQSWTLAGGRPWSWSVPLAVTCDELFAAGRRHRSIATGSPTRTRASRFARPWHSAGLIRRWGMRAANGGGGRSEVDGVHGEARSSTKTRPD